MNKNTGIIFLALCCGMNVQAGLLSNDPKKQYEEIGKQVFDAADKTILADVKIGARRDYSQWNKALENVNNYIKSANPELVKAKFLEVLDERNDRLRQILNKNSVGTVDVTALSALIKSLEPERIKLKKLIEQIRGERFTSASQRYAAELLDYVFASLQMAALNFSTQIEEALRQTSPETLAAKAKNIQDASAEFNRLASKVGSKPGFFERLDARIKQWVGSKGPGADTQYMAIMQKVEKLTGINDPNFRQVLGYVNEFADRYNKEARTRSGSVLEQALTRTIPPAEAKERSAFAQSEAEKIRKSPFTSREKRFAYELYAKLWQKAAAIPGSVPARTGGKTGQLAESAKAFEEAARKVAEQTKKQFEES